MILTRRNFLIGALAAPAVVKAEILMPVRQVIVPEPIVAWDVGREPSRTFMWVGVHVDAAAYAWRCIDV